MFRTLHVETMVSRIDTLDQQVSFTTGYSGSPSIDIHLGAKHFGISYNGGRQALLFMLIKFAVEARAETVVITGQG